MIRVEISALVGINPTVFWWILTPVLTHTGTPYLLMIR